MAVPGLLGDYILKNYRRLLICVAPVTSDTSEDADLPTLEELSDAGFANSQRNHSRRRRRSSLSGRLRSPRRRSGRIPSFRFSRTDSSSNTNRDDNLTLPYGRDEHGHRLVRDDPFRGCVSSRSDGPRMSGDFVVMGCMQV